VALLVGFEDDHAVLWQIFSHVVKLFVRLELDGKRTDENTLYNFYESVVKALKPVLKEGIRSIVAVSPVRTTYATDFLGHIRKHHRYLIQSKSPNRANFVELVGSADDRIKVAELVKTKKFAELIEETISEEADQVVSSLEKNLYGDGCNSVVYSLKEIEDSIYRLEKSRPFETEYLLITDKYLADSKQKNRINRLVQISKNKKVKTRVVNAETAAGNRINQFGGLVFFTVPFKQMD
jgi:stalled ribosome rescue protein Dom34